MAGLDLMGGAQVGWRPPSTPTTATEAAFGAAAAPAPSGLAALSPDDPAGIAFWWAVASFGALIFLYYTLPA
jgi:hypothetical protein